MTRHMTFVKNRLAWLAVAALLASPIFGWAQATPIPSQTGPESKSIPISKVERKNRAPVSKEILRVKLPKPIEATLDNGLTVLILENRRLPSVSVELTISGAGGLYDPPTLPGLANITAQMAREGTKT
ncbi:MAG: hypothetical protein ACRD1T_25500, partial [Acidimicrobiia bacterium]